MKASPTHPSPHLPAPRVAIALSAGYFGFFAHAGFLLAIEEAGIDYCAIAGSSAGAIVAALHASGVSAQEIAEALVQIRREDFWDSAGVHAVLRALTRKGRGWTGWLKGDLFEQMMEDRLRVSRFEECRRALYITAFNLTTGAEETFHSGRIADKVRASCSYPFLLSAKEIGGCHYWDGGFLSKVPLAGMLEGERPDVVIVHYLPTQKPQGEAMARKWSALGLLEVALTAARQEIERHRMAALSDEQHKIVWVEPSVPRVEPHNLATGRAAIRAAQTQAAEELKGFRQTLSL